MAFTLADIRTALKAQLEANLSGREQNIDVYNENMPPPSIVASLVETPTYTGSYSAVALAKFVLTIRPGGTDGSAVARLDSYLDTGQGNNSSVVDALRGAGRLKDLALYVAIEPGAYDQENVTADLNVTIAVNKLLST